MRVLTIEYVIFSLAVLLKQWKKKSTTTLMATSQSITYKLLYFIKRYLNKNKLENQPAVATPSGLVN